VSETHRNGEGEAGRGLPTPDPMGSFPDMPDAWLGILSPREWQVAAAAIGRPRLDELRGMLAEVGEPFRAAFVRHLARIAPDQPAGAAVMMAIAHAAHDTRADRQA